MPVINRTRDSAQSHLFDQLVREWKGESEGGPEAPIILMEGGLPDRPSRVFVKWNAWEPLSARERSQMILDAAERVLGIDAALDILAPMGVTAKEAAEMDIRFE